MGTAIYQAMRSEKVRKLSEIADPAEARVILGGFVMFDLPGEFVRDEHAPAARPDRGHDVGAERVADHHPALCPVAVTGEDRGVGLGRLLRHDLDPVEEFAQPGLGHLALLIEQVALRHDEEPVVGRQRLHRLPRVGEEFDGVAQHLLPGFDQFADDAAGHLLLRHLERGFDHRQDEALDAEAIVAEVPPFRREEAGVERVGVGVVGEQRGEAVLRQAEEALVVPERVVGVEGDGGGSHDRGGEPAQERVGRRMGAGQRLVGARGGRDPDRRLA